MARICLKDVLTFICYRMAFSQRHFTPKMHSIIFSTFQEILYGSLKQTIHEYLHLHLRIATLKNYIIWNQEKSLKK